MLWFVAACLFGLAAAKPMLGGDPSISVPYVIGGADATDGQFPWQLSLEFNGANGWSHTCGASLIELRYALTAAHCIDGRTFNNLRVWAGMLSRSNPASTNAQMITLSSMKMHENYIAAGSYPNDFAILTLSTNANTAQSNIALATLPPDDTNDFAHGSCWISGWGRTSASNVLPDILQWVQIPVITNTQCETLMAPAVYQTHICVYSGGGAGGCNGDSGGPLQCYSAPNNPTTRYMVGVTSWVIATGGACNTNFPTVYGRVSKFLDWISINTP